MSNPLQDALLRLEEVGGTPVTRAAAIEAALASAIRAVLPGRQQKGNVGPYIETGRKAFLRTIRRRTVVWHV